MDKTVLEVVPLSQADDELSYWLGRTFEERCQGIELIRRVLYGEDDTSARLQRVLSVASSS